MHHHPRRIAIILPDTLQCMGLQQILVDYFPPVEIFCSETFKLFCQDNNDIYDYYFTSSDYFLLNADFFIPRRTKTMILTKVAVNICQANSGFYLSVDSSLEVILEQIQELFASETNNNLQGENNKDLSTREIEVLQLIVKGITNKEIADKLNISFNTVLTHRKNITSKLGIKTVSGLTFYAIMNGLISGEDIEL